MAETHIISGLTKKRGEILGSINHYKSLISQLDKDLSHIDATIQIFEPDFNFGKRTRIVNKHRNSYFERGEAKTLILDTLRQQQKPIRTDKLSLIIAEYKQLDISNNTEKRNFQKSIIGTLSILEKSNLIERVSKDGLVIIWKIKEIV
jgi:hypothetical protein